ncbi:MAG: hypothetical protein GXP17_05685 [Gammaproteobacteria bacterium]|nr:hypothetical protein [Gammaproteobacteria bacterium]
MHHIARYSTSLAVLLIALLSMSTAYAEHTSSSRKPALPDDYPKIFPAMGIVMDIDVSTISIDGSRYTLSISLIVHSPTGKGSRFDLRKGVEVGFSYSDEPNAPLIISEIWVLPKGTYEPR